MLTIAVKGFWIELGIKKHGVLKEGVVGILWRT